MTTTTDIARAHGYTGPVVCEDCGTTDLLHFASWFNHQTGESGDFLQCCACGIKAGDPAELHEECEPDEAEEPDAEDTPAVRVFRRTTGWVTPDFTDLADCTSNFHREQDGRPPCTATAVWKVVEDHSMHLTISFWCDTDLPGEHKPQAEAAR